MMKSLLKTAFAAAALLAGCGAALAADVSFTGNLAHDDEVQLFSFTLAADADVTLRTWSYAGGVNAAGSLIASGGFDPIVSLFSGAGGAALLIGANDDGAGVAVDPSTGSAYDSLLEVLALPAGTYTVALTEFANSANAPTLGDGFSGSGVQGFDGRTAAWALDIVGVDAASRIPEPTSLALALFGLAAAGAARRRHA
jgi:MYXO-CTERM domain-containing protein